MGWLLALLLHPCLACGPFIVNVDLDGGHDGTGSEGGITTEQVDDSTTADSVTSTTGPDGTTTAPDSGSTSLDTGGSTESTTGHEPSCHIVGPDQQCECDEVPAPSEWCEPCEWSDDVCLCDGIEAPVEWCPPRVCILPHFINQSWCAAQREVAMEIGCKTMVDPWSCYETITAQYTEGDPAMVQASDCDTAIDGPLCEEAWTACSNASGPNACELWDPATHCQILAQMEGIGFAFSMEACTAIIAHYG